MPQFAHLLLGQILIEHQGISLAAIEQAISTQHQEGRQTGRYRLLGEILLELALISPEQLTAALDFQQEQFAQSLIGAYRLESLLGQGGMGTVYRARQLGGKKENHMVAIKLVAQKKPGDIAALARFQSEAQAGAALDHPHIVRTLDFGTTRDCYYLVCELMPNGTLHDRINKNGFLSETDTLTLAIAMLQALDHAHHRGLMHRDIKPANILYDATDIPRLADLGLARAISEQKDGARAQNAAGTPAFMAPEQAIGPERCDARADLYSLGATLFYALTGAPPFTAKRSLAVINQHLNEAPPDLHSIRQTLSVGTVAFIRKLMAKRPDDRYANAAEAIADIRRIQNDERPLALALTPEQAYAPLKVTLQTREQTTEATPTASKKNVSELSEKEAAHATYPTPLTRTLSRTPAAVSNERTPSSNKISSATNSPGSASIKKNTTERSNSIESITPAKQAISPPALKKSAGATLKASGHKASSSPAKKSLIPLVLLGISLLGCGIISLVLLSGDKTPAAQTPAATEIPAPPRLAYNNSSTANSAAQATSLSHSNTKSPSEPFSPPQQNGPEKAADSPQVSLEKTNSAFPDNGQEIDILALINKHDLTKLSDAKKSSDWALQNSVLVSDKKQNKDLLSFPIILPHEYDVTCTFKRFDAPAEFKKNASFTLLFPVKASRCALLIRGENSTRMGVEYIDGKPAHENGSTFNTQLPFDHKFTVTIQVRAATVSIYLDNKRFFFSPIEGRTFDAPLFWGTNKKYAFGIGSSRCSTEVSQLLVKGISGPITAVPDALMERK
jgi:serine/threonine protein kinase